jgi:hypothetical protein
LAGFSKEGSLRIIATSIWGRENWGRYMFEPEKMGKGENEGKEERELGTHGGITEG